MMFEALYNVGVNIRMIATSEIRITVLIDEADVDTATKAVHDKSSKTKRYRTIKEPEKRSCT